MGAGEPGRGCVDRIQLDGPARTDGELADSQAEGGLELLGCGAIGVADVDLVM